MKHGWLNRMPLAWAPENRVPAAIILIALAVRLYFALVVGVEHNRHFDMLRYNQLALQGGVSFAPPPGYPIFLRTIYSISGNLNYRAVYLVQSLISAAVRNPSAGSGFCSRLFAPPYWRPGPSGTPCIQASRSPSSTRRCTRRASTWRNSRMPKMPGKRQVPFTTTSRL